MLLQKETSDRVSAVTKRTKICFDEEILTKVYFIRLLYG